MTAGRWSPRPTAEEVVIRPDLYGEHQTFNMAAAVAAAVALDLDFVAAAEALQSVRLDSRWRMEVDTSADGVTVINDAYNANPSMGAGLRAPGGDGPGQTHLGGAG